LGNRAAFSLGLRRKRASNLIKHGFDFVVVEELFDRPVLE
jgi:uncharacterized DUF497 family protein